MVDGRPILINDENSVFAIEDFLLGRATTPHPRGKPQDIPSPMSSVKNAVRRLVPDISASVSDITIKEVADLVLAEIPNPRVLVIGAGDALLDVRGRAEVVYSDVALTELAEVIADAHDIPFRDGTFDFVVAASVLQHVADPARCVAEMTRVLVPRGFIYAVAPFMQQVHAGRYDFTRFSYVGLRRLFRRFDEQRSGVANGPAMALAWSFEHFLAAFSERPKGRAALRSLARMMIFPLLCFDRIIGRKAGAYTSASAFYFFGRKRETAIPDREIIATYRPPVR